jgi:K+-transporting ATPase KdpF subunit
MTDAITLLMVQAPNALYETFGHLIEASLALLLLAYLIYSLVKPEKF